MQTYSYKQVGDLSIECDVYEPTISSNGSAILWLHGGGLVGGSRKWIPQFQLELYLKAGYTLVAADYRLVPETKLPGIVEDVIDAFHWVTDHIASGKHPCVVGHSGGGYLALLLGTKLGVRPKAIVSFYGYAEILAKWYTAPSAHYLGSPEITEAEAHASVGTAELSDASDQLNRFTFYIYCRQRGSWPVAAMGLDPEKHPEAFLPYSPCAMIDAKYPPTLLIHGNKDWDVPYEQSKKMRDALVAFGNTCKLLTIDKGGHMFDSLFEGDPPASAMKPLNEAIKFLDEHRA